MTSEAAHQKQPLHRVLLEIIPHLAHHVPHLFLIAVRSVSIMETVKLDFFAMNGEFVQMLSVLRALIASAAKDSFAPKYIGVITALCVATI